MVKSERDMKRKGRGEEEERRRRGETRLRAAL
jgi:hypothetical protein